ncbi:Superoxide dismutase [Cu-Zn] [Sulfitobacter indolifex]|uniref:Superoxide dismutase, copper/zinc binding protein n=1 Tax=Sulfitobacter indolifex HEL-45 TaxID=391624 RepID=A0ABP2DBJ2_9RHOB|nr:superoxide dismutase family protein [Sulfitobacter indolifex]EDQ05665.1 superoxide dismutase, copper/zinc binding protein [Sulfitobacter indolifex HEL-45]UOA19838.1 Superoxide dismutase [Cu-Zn] [Sulfitobacter indolifex]
MYLCNILLGAALVTTGAVAAQAEGHMQTAATAQVAGKSDDITGSVTLNTTASGRMLVKIDVTGVPTGTHGVHLHETGDCSADDFTSAGGHIAGDHQHGVLVEGGPHPGDMPNMVVGDDGVLQAEVFLDLLDIDGMIKDDDGAAFVIHDGADDYTSQPAGDAGSRIACGVFEAS